MTYAQLRLTTPQTFNVPSAALKKVSETFALAGIHINGDRPWDIHVHDPRFYARVLSEGSMGAGESYVEGWWDVEALDDFFTRLHRIDPYAKVGKWGTLWLALKMRVLNCQTRSRSNAVAHAHYDLGTDIYRAMLDCRMQYSCA